MDVLSLSYFGVFEIVYIPNRSFKLTEIKSLSSAGNHFEFKLT
jgi:hypothetical protein